VPDSQPNYLTIDPTTGKTGAKFTGYVQAEGLDLTAVSTASSPEAAQPTPNEIRWHKSTPSGPVVARIISDNSPYMYLDAGDPFVDGQNARLGLEPNKRNFGANSQYSQIYASIEDKSAVILRANGTSDFLQTAGIRVAYFQGPLNGGANSDKNILGLIRSRYIAIVQGSSWSPGAGTMGIDVYLNGSLYLTSQSYVNEVNSHRPNNIGICYFDYGGGSILVQLRTKINTATDSNDFMYVLFIPVAAGTTVIT
jgi:hypothetical protein